MTGPGEGSHGRLPIEFVNVAGWLTNSDVALDSCAQFLAVAEHRIILTRAKSVGHHLRKADRQSVCAPACQDRISGGHAGVGVISLCAAPLSAPSLVPAEFSEFFRLGRAMRVLLPTGDGGVVHLFVEYGTRCRRRTLRSFRLLTSCFVLYSLRLRWCVWAAFACCR